MTLRHGDFTRLARDYARTRAGYAPGVPGRLVGLVTRGGDRSPGELDFVDVGAGTGIWTRMVARLGCRTVAVEPNEAMFAEGCSGEPELGIEWRRGSAEATGLSDGAADLVTMASSFHWTDFDRATAEFERVLRPGGVFAALWNTRRLEANPLFVEIEAELERLVPGLERVSSGRSCEALGTRLPGRFDDVRYFEDEHVERMTPTRYLGIWRSVNDVQVQAGEETFARFLAFVEERTRDLEWLDATYVTRVWAGYRRSGAGTATGGGR